MRWLLSDFLLPLLRAHFYCTESEVYRQDVFYYRCFMLCITPLLSEQKYAMACPGLSLLSPRTEGSVHGCQKPEYAVKLLETSLSL